MAHRHSIIQDIFIPPELLWATGNIGSKRDRGATFSWAPQLANADVLNQLSRIDTQTTIELEHSAMKPSENTKRNASKRITWSGALYKRSGGRQVDELPISPTEKAEDPLKCSRPFSYTPGVNIERHRNFKKPVHFHSCTARPDESNALGPTAKQNPIYRTKTSASFTQPNFESKFLSRLSIRNASNSQANSSNQLTTKANNGSISPSSSKLEAQAQGQRRKTFASIVTDFMPNILQRRDTVTSRMRRSSLWPIYERAKERGKEIQRDRKVQIAFECSIYIILISIMYFVLIGVPLWKGAVWWLWWAVAHKFTISAGFSITLGIALFYAFAPLMFLFEKNPPDVHHNQGTPIHSNVDDTALLIPCYKSANLIAATIEAALNIFPPSHIFVIANGNSPTPLDNTEEVCKPYKVNHIWSPVGSKIVAQFVGCYAAKSFKNVLLIDDDCALPPNFPVVTDRLVGNVQCIGYTIKSVGPNSTKGNLCQQAQDLEYKLSGIQREFAGRVGSATFPHGAISLWDRELLVKTFYEHPGFSVSEDWFFGHVARKLGCRIKMCSQVFVETETPTAVFFSSGGSRGGFGEMTIFSQRFKRWNFFFVNGMWYNMAYILSSWKLGWWEIGAKIFVFQEVYETLLYLLTPFILPISFYVQPLFCGILLASTIIMYLVNVIIFNEVHLRRKGERLGWILLYIYYLPYKIVLTGINVTSCYWSLYKYARYFAKRHPKVTEDEKAVEVVIRLEDNENLAATAGYERRDTLCTVTTRSFNRDSIDATTIASQVKLPVSRVIMQPPLVHGPIGAPKMQSEGIAATDFFARHENKESGDGWREVKYIV